MANKKPLKLESGKLKEMAATDTVPTSNLGTGTADSTKFLRGDQTWQVPAGGGGSGVAEELAIAYAIAL